MLTAMQQKNLSANYIARYKTDIDGEKRNVTTRIGSLLFL